MFLPAIFFKGWDGNITSQGILKKSKNHVLKELLRFSKFSSLRWWGKGDQGHKRGQICCFWIRLEMSSVTKCQTLSGWSPSPIAQRWKDWHLHVGILVPSVGFCRKWCPQMEVFLFADPTKKRTVKESLRVTYKEAEYDAPWIKQVCNEMYNILSTVGKNKIHI